MPPGRVEVIAGPMFAGKTEELPRRVRRALIAGRRVQVFTHRLDTRKGTDRVASHAGLDHPSLVAASADESSGRSGPTATWSPSTRPTSSPPT